MANTPKHQPLIDQFVADLRALSPIDVIRKHITTGNPVEISADDYYQLRKLVAEEFQIHPSAVILIGSCRQGFSIAPKKRYRAARESSDLDVSIISQDRFDFYWDNVFAYSRADGAWKSSSEYNTFVRTLFMGWIDPRGLPAVPRFEQAAKWTEFFDGLMRTRQFGSRRISARLYRTWQRLEAYQEANVRKCLNALGEQTSA